MNDYETMTDAELNKAVAEELGYRDVRYYLGDLCADDRGRVRILPNYASDVGAAIWLLTGIGHLYRWSIRNSRRMFECEIKPVASMLCWQAEDKSLPRAICIAFLKSRQNDGGADGRE